MSKLPYKVNGSSMSVQRSTAFGEFNKLPRFGMNIRSHKQRLNYFIASTIMDLAEALSTFFFCSNSSLRYSFENRQQPALAPARVVCRSFVQNEIGCRARAQPFASRKSVFERDEKIKKKWSNTKQIRIRVAERNRNLFKAFFSQQQERLEASTKRCCFESMQMSLFYSEALSLNLFNRMLAVVEKEILENSGFYRRLATCDCVRIG